MGVVALAGEICNDLFNQEAAARTDSRYESGGEFEVCPIEIGFKSNCLFLMLAATDLVSEIRQRGYNSPVKVRVANQDTENARLPYPRSLDL